MDVKWLEKLITLLVSLFLLASGGTLFAFAMGWQGRPLLAWLASLRETPFDGAVIGAALLLAALYLLATLVRDRQDGGSIIQETELGQVEISLKAIMALTKRAARDIPGIRDLTPEVKVDPQGLDIRVVAQVDSGLSIPTLAGEVQARIRNYLYETVGYPVYRVKVDVRDIRHDAKPRIE
jgi:uncharacterized alkaline shock family protein YloU